MIKVNTMPLAGLGFCAGVFACVAFAQDTQPADIEKRATLALEKAQAAEEKANAAQATAKRAADDRYAVLKDVEGFFDRALNRVLATIGIILGGLGIGVALLLFWLDKRRNELFELRTEEIMTAVSAAKDAAKGALEQSEKGVAEALQRIDQAQREAFEGIGQTAGVLWLEFARTAEASSDWRTAWCDYCHAANSFMLSREAVWLLRPLARLAQYCGDEARMAAQIWDDAEAKVRFQEVLDHLRGVSREGMDAKYAAAFNSYVQKLEHALASWGSNGEETKPDTERQGDGLVF